MEEKKEALLGERESERKQSESAKKVEIHLFRQGEGPIAVFESELGGCEQNRLEVREILHKYSLKSIFAFNPRSGRAVPIRFNPKTGYSVLSYRNAAVLYIDGEPKESLLKPVYRILVGVALIAIMLMLVYGDIGISTAEWVQKLNVSGVDYPPLIVACVVVVFSRMRHRTRRFLKRLGL
ncbi:hypothetical protein MtrunA17_Chr1g0201111 [Medicago truncatula]|uniref:Transmembrane protein, putative n=1 Tax=Medicago truncatula TaxID=3880 RepID=A0A072VPM4_MEDTR|nr:uncharacterized protein LOC25485025 [Medicago truncatula]KEH43616.1 transmembrane protein, putative [Medicago truncatula]RHN81616.1 hypothetical protein MtrunA17_Chr1g0201111 [Medicago truncatula]